MAFYQSLLMIFCFLYSEKRLNFVSNSLLTMSSLNNFFFRVYDIIFCCSSTVAVDTGHCLRCTHKSPRWRKMRTFLSVLGGLKVIQVMVNSRRNHFWLPTFFSNFFPMKWKNGTLQAVIIAVKMIGSSLHFPLY